MATCETNGHLWGRDGKCIMCKTCGCVESYPQLQPGQINHGPLCPLREKQTPAPEPRAATSDFALRACRLFVDQDVGCECDCGKLDICFRCAARAAIQECDE